MKRIILLLSVVLIASSCCNCGRKSNDVATLQNTNWELIEMNGQVISRAKDANNYTMLLTDDNKINGVGDCNRYFGGFEVNNNTMKVGDLASTRMMCPNQAQENAFLKMLSTVHSYKIDGRILMLSDVDNKLVATFQRGAKPTEDKK